MKTSNPVRAAVVAVSLSLSACTVKTVNPDIEPDVGAVISSAYWRGREAGLDELRRNPVWKKPIYACKKNSAGEPEVSWVDPEAESPSWGSRGRNIKLLENCDKNAGYNGGLAVDQREAVDRAR